MTLVAIALWAAIPLAAPALASATSDPANVVEGSPEDRLARGRQAYLRNDFAQALLLVRPLVDPEIQLRTTDDILAAYRVLALSHFLRRDEPAAETQFLAILQLSPTFALDPVSDPPSAIAFFERIRLRESERIQALERRQREEAERVHREEEQERERTRVAQLRDQEDRIRRSLQPIVVERHVRSGALVPLGFGQFQNGQAAKGHVFLGTQLALAALSVGCWATLQARYDGGATAVPRDEWWMARTLQGVAIGAGALFWIDAAWGIADALWHFQSTVQPVAVHDTDARLRPPLRLAVTPLPIPDGGGLAAQLRF